MFSAILAAAAAFISTNLDDILLLTLLFAQANGRRSAIAAGQLAGMGVLTTVSVLCARLIQGLPEPALALLGLIPIALGIRFRISCRGSDNEEPQAAAVGFLSVLLLTVSNGGDNVGVYVPLFAGYSLSQTAVVCVVFFLMTLLWCLLGSRLSSLPKLKTFLLNHRHIVMPLVLVSLGLYIILEHTIL